MFEEITINQSYNINEQKMSGKYAYMLWRSVILKQYKV